MTSGTVIHGGPEAENARGPIAELESQHPSQAHVDPGTHGKSEAYNGAMLAGHLIAHRMAWIFKTESVLIPAFVDAFAGAAWVRGCLPFLNRLGQSLPVIFFAGHVDRSRKKKQLLALTTVVTGLAFLSWGFLWRAFGPQTRTFWLSILVPPTYFLFAGAYGLYQLVLATLQGKLIRAERRGRLLGISGGVGAVGSILLAWLLLERWLALPGGGWERVFICAGGGFLVSALFTLPIAEQADAPPTTSVPRENAIRAAIDFFRNVAAFRGLVIVTFLFMTSQLLFPHYQALGLAQPGAKPTDMMSWVIAQNAALGVFSVIAGAISDRHGTRRALTFLIAIAAVTPLTAVTLASGLVPHGQRAYWIAYALLGSVPVTLKVLFNYVLEAIELPLHARAIGALQVCMAAPYLFAPLLGYAVDLTGFPPAFMGVAIAVGAGAVGTLRLPEPRDSAPSSLSQPAGRARG